MKEHRTKHQLLDRRLLGGDQTLYGKPWKPGFPSLSTERRGLSRHLSGLTHSRHAKFQDTLYHCAGLKETLVSADLHLLGFRKLHKRTRR